jgi:hypothetical protein
MNPMGLRTKNDCAGEIQQQFTGPTGARAVKHYPFCYCVTFHRETSLRSDWRQTSEPSDALSQDNHVPHSSAHITGLLEKKRYFMTFNRTYFGSGSMGFEIF